MTIMLFRRIDDYAQESYCRRYTVGASRTMGVWTYTPWRRGAYQGAAPTLLAHRRITDPEEARQICRDHAEAEALKGAA